MIGCMHSKIEAKRGIARESKYGCLDANVELWRVLDNQGSISNTLCPKYVHFYLQSGCKWMWTFG